MLKRQEEALKWLEYAYEARAGGLLEMNLEPHLDWLRPDPRFQDLVKRAGFPVVGEQYGLSIEIH